MKVYHLFKMKLILTMKLSWIKKNSTKSVPKYQLQTKDNDDNINDQQCNEDDNNKNDNNSSNNSIIYNQSEGNHNNNIIKGNRKKTSTKSVSTYHSKY